VCYLWFKSQQWDRTRELEHARRDRKKAYVTLRPRTSAARDTYIIYRIIERLEALGWKSEIEQIPMIDDLGNHRLVKQPTRLTERSPYFLSLYRGIVTHEVV
jgi:hypothetical protein